MKWIDRLKKEAKALKLKAQVLIVAYTDKRTPLIAKVLIWITLGYLMSPIDLIPDFIPVIGLLDDLVIVPILITYSIKHIPKEVWADASAKALANPVEMKKTNRVLAVLIVLIWLMVLYYCIKLILSLINV